MNQHAALDQHAEGPRFSLLLASDPVEAPRTRRTISSVLAQTMPRWELLVVGSQPIVPGRKLFGTRPEPRIRQVDGWNAAVANARGDYLVFLDPGTQLNPAALALLNRAAQPNVDFLYGDEERLDPATGVLATVRRPDWSPERLRAQQYCGDLVVLRTAVVRELGGLRAQFGGAMRYDLVLRVTERGGGVAHLPLVLCRTEAQDDGETETETGQRVRVVQEHLDRMGITAHARPGAVPGLCQVERQSRVPGLVSAIVLTRGSDGIVWGRRRVFVVEAVRALLRHAGDVELEVVVVYDPPTPATVLAELRALVGDRLVLVEYRKPFNYAEKSNVGVAASHGRWLLLLNDDTEITSDRFVERLITPLLEPGVGMTGARLLFEDTTIQHAGVVYRKGDPGHTYYGFPDEDPGVECGLLVNRECTALTAACVALSRSLYDQVGGITELLPGNFNDVDFSLKIATQGQRLVWIHDARAFHFESKTRDSTVNAAEHNLLKSRWASGLADRYQPGVPCV